MPDGLAKRIIPCLDVKGGRVVKGVHFLNLKDAGDPAEVSRTYSDAGADEVVFLDITASLQDRAAMLDVIKRCAEEVFIPLTVGGGIKTIKDIRLLLKNGADKISINTAALKKPSLISEAAKEFGSQCIVVAIDAKATQQAYRSGFSSRWQVYAYGGTKPTGRDALEWAQEAERLGAGEILLTSMDRDGTQDGYDLELTKAISKKVNIPVIASGGAGNLKHLFEALTEGCADAVLAASIFHYGHYTIAQAKEYLKDKEVEVRIA